MIIKHGNKWQVKDSSGKKILGTHGTKIAMINSFASSNNPTLATNVVVADRMLMTVENGQQSNQGESSYHYRRIRYWNYPVDDDNMKSFVKGDVEPRGTWNPYG